MTENGRVEQGLSRDEALAIAEKKLRAKRVTMVAKPPEGEVVRIRKEPGVAQLIAAHYEKARSRMGEGSTTKAMMDGMERMVYDGAKVAGVAVQGADFIIGGLLVGHGLRGVTTGKDRFKLFGLDLTTAKNYGKMIDEGQRDLQGRPILTKIGWLSPQIGPDRFMGAAKLLGGIGMLRYAPATMVARTALNLTL